MPVTLTLTVPREVHIDDDVMFDTLRLMPVSRASKKRWANNPKGIAFLEPGTRRKDEPHAEERGL